MKQLRKSSASEFRYSIQVDARHSPLLAHSDDEVPETLGRCPWVTGPSAGRRASFVRSLIGDSGEKSYSDWLDGEPPILAANRSAGNRSKHVGP